MKKSLVLLAGASMAFLGLPAVSHAQAASGPFADVPTDHWAYQSVDTLQKAGIVIGYPDGTYGGRRPMTRYEFAVAIARLLAQMNQNKGYATTADLAALRSDLETRIAGNTAAIDALRTLVNGFQPELTRLGQDVAAADARLDALEARVNALGGRLDRDEGILGSVVDEQRRVKVTGDVNFIAEGVSSRHRNASGAYSSFLDKNGVLQGGTTPLGNPTYDDRLLGASDVYHDILLHIRGKVADTTTANVDLDFGNYLSNVGNTAAFPGYPTNGAGGNFLSPGFASPGSTNGVSNQYANVYKAYLDAAVKLGPLGGAELLVGRFGSQLTKYTLKQAEADVYASTIQTSSGDIIQDGAGVNFKLGPAHVGLTAGKMTTDEFSQPYGGSVGVTYNPGTGPTPGNPFAPVVPGFFNRAQGRPGGLIGANHAAPLDQGYTARATFGAPEGAVLGVTLEQFGLRNNGLNGLGVNDGLTDPNHTFSNPFLGSGANGQYNRLTVYGVDFNGALPFGVPGVKKGGILLDGAYTVSAHGLNQGFNNVGKDFQYQSFDTQLGAAFGGLTLKGGYQYVGPEFSAPGYWGKIGAWTNPTNVRGPVVSAKFAFTPKLTLNADYEAYKAAYGSNRDGTPVNSPLQQNDHLNRYQVGLGYGLSSTYGVDLGYENVQYDLRNTYGGAVTGLASAGKPIETYTTIGIGHTISNNASIKLLYQIVHYDDKGTNFDANSEANGNDGHSNGSVAAAQFQLKF